MSGRVALEASFSLRQYGAWCDRGRCDRVAGHAADLWTALLDVGEAAPQGWVLIGGQMVLLHAIEHGVAWPRVSMDLDVLVNARVTASVRRFVAVIESIGFALDGMSPEMLAHRIGVGGRPSMFLLRKASVSGRI